jgi:hypothetical protein
LIPINTVSCNVSKNLQLGRLRVDVDNMTRWTKGRYNWLAQKGRGKGEEAEEKLHGSETAR